ncbi:MAG: hypothetical protein RLZZ282_1275, partial [Verrucomicrobiota bacterium]
MALPFLPTMIPQPFSSLTLTRIITPTLWLLVGSLASLAHAQPLPALTRHSDHRNSPKLVVLPQTNAPVANGRLEADHFLEKNHADFLLPQNLENLPWVATRESLLGTHYRYRQTLNGLPVVGADMVVSISHESGEVYQAYNNTYPVAQQPQLPKPLISKDVALDAAWNHLRVHGKLLADLRSQLVYLPQNGGFRLIYKTLVATDAPLGHWEHLIDATDGSIVAARNSVVHLNKQPQPTPDFSTYHGPVNSRADAELRWDASRAVSKQRLTIQKTAVNGTARVFDGDPRTILANPSLVDDSPASAFSLAYVTRPLRDISFSNGVYSLDGPWVQITDLEAPNSTPSTTTTGNWTALRGNNAFNDVMTYFHIDQNQRYLQSLGYTGATGIQFGPIQADSDGDNGADNSYYSPTDNQLVFGHGGVDDNEDPDVILHEYAHAITYDITPSWGGGDADAIGEGFGDYWAASYNSTTTNGSTFHPEWAFSWDAHSADTWDGRFLDKTSLTYDPHHTYGAHESLAGIDNYSDQLWGTPLFQAFLALRDLGYPREDMDKILIESFFGIGRNPTMRDMANATVNAAKRLFPSGPHADTFAAKFSAQRILSNSPSAFTATPATTSQIDLSWNRNSSLSNVLVAWNTTNSFGSPTGTYTAGDTIAGGGTVLYNGSATNISATGLSLGAKYYYMAWSVLDGPSYSTGITTSTSTVILPVITWPNPKAITYGTPLSNTQFKVKANVQGTYTFSPMLGTRLPAGTHTLTATFIPTDAVRYASVIKSVPLIVNKVSAKVTLAGLKQSYDGIPKPVTVTTKPADLYVDTTYGGATDAPINAGTYPVMATVNDPNASGS